MEEEYRGSSDDRTAAVAGELTWPSLATAQQPHRAAVGDSDDRSKPLEVKLLLPATLKNQTMAPGKST
jgi:hypothetical protein